MTIQQRLFLFKGRIGRRDFWIWVGLWIVDMLAPFSLASKQLFDIQTAVFCLVCLLWPTAAATVKRLHDRGRFGTWVLLTVLAWMLLAEDWAMLPGIWQWAVGHFVPTLILVGMLTDLGVFIDTQDANKYGKDIQNVKYRVDS